MKKRRTLVISLLLIAALALGIGYAAYTYDLNINGVVSVGAPAPKVIFEKVEYVESKGNVTSADNYGELLVGGQSIDLNIQGLREATEYVTVKYTVKNGHDFPVTVSATAAELTGSVKYEDNIAVTTGAWLDTTGAALANNQIPAGGSATFTVTVTLTNSFATDNGVTQNFHVSFTATGVGGSN